jgi:adenylate cyclase
MGIVLAAVELGLDLTQAQVDEHRQELRLSGTNGVSRTIPLDADGAFNIDWSLSTTDSRLLFEPIHSLLDQHLARAAGETNGLTNLWQGRLVLVGSSATGNDLTDRGSTPLEKDTLLVSEHWNIANSLLTGRFIQRTPLAVNLAIIAVVGALTALLTWRLRALTAAIAVLALGGIYCGIAAWLYVRWRIWVPLILPVGVAIMVQHVCLVSYRVVFEEREKRRVRSFFAKVVSPDIVQELLRADKLSSFDGAHREITVMFSDVRGFTDLTDRNRETAEQHIRENRLSAPAATTFLDEQARETLLTVNLYLSVVADRVKQHTGTLDKYIGDCVMAFWGAPTPNPRHALAAVQSAIDAQRAIAGLNRQRAEENQRRAAASPPLPPLPLLSLGSGINTGVAIVGLMGSDDHILNYTVFGREVNLASRLESVSGRGRIVIGETTFQHLERDAPALAARCQQLAPTSVKGIREALVCYEVPWQENGQGPKAGG